MDIFKRGDKVWFEYEKNGHFYERCGYVLDGPFSNGFYRIKTANGAVDFIIHKDDIHRERPDHRIRLEDVYKQAKDMLCNNAEKTHPFMLGDLVVYKDASKPITFIVIDVIEYTSPQGTISYSYKIKRTNNNNSNSDTIVHIVDHDRLEKVQLKCGYEYRRGDYVQFEYDGFTRIGEVIELLYADTDRGSLYKIKGHSGQEYLVSQGKIKGLAPNDDIVKYVNEDKMSINDIRKMMGIKPIKEDNNMKTKKEQKKRNRNIIKTEKDQRTIKDISFNGPAVIVKFEPTGNDLAYGRFKGDKVVVVCKDGDEYDKKTGFLLAILKEFLNNQSYGNILEKLDSFDDSNDFRFKVGDIVRLKNGHVKFEIGKCTTWRTKSGKVINRYRIDRIDGSHYSTYENEDRIEKA